MRTLLLVTLDTPASNELVASGRISEVMDKVMGTLKPEAAYFHPAAGHRAMTLVVDLPDEASIVTICEPLWMELGAEVEMIPCMNADEVRTGLGRFGTG
jgi:hypothetical protein